MTPPSPRARKHETNSIRSDPIGCRPNSIPSRRAVLRAFQATAASISVPETAPNAHHREMLVTYFLRSRQRKNGQLRQGRHTLAHLIISRAEAVSQDRPGFSRASIFAMHLSGVEPAKRGSREHKQKNKGLEGAAARLMMGESAVSAEKQKPAKLAPPSGLLCPGSLNSS